ncbi:MAG: hypothetical protein JWQ98_3227 [Chlorobi bacterium]|nr:hypothetical protein [Chlorobiota bacterium]
MFACIGIAMLAFITGLGARPVHSPVQFQFPLQGSRWVLPGADIIIRPGSPLDPSISSSLLNVRGSISGGHAGRIIISADRTTLTFRPEKSFVPNERVTVSVGRGLRDDAGAAIAPFTFSFGTSLTRTPPTVDRAALDELNPGVAASPMAISAASGIGGGDTPPADASYFPSSFPKITITNAVDPSPGVIFLSNIVFNAAIPTTQYLMTLDNAGVPTFAARAGGQSYDFKRQTNGTMTFASGNVAKFYALDSSFAVVDSFACGGGYTLDIHDLQILPNGHALVLGIDPQVMDMSQIVQGGSSTAVVVGLVIQELDSLKNVVFQWRSFDHFQVTDATHEDLTAPTIDYVHVNAIQLDNDGNILLSSRHMDEVTKINRATGDIIWRLGGKNNQFTFTNDTLGFSHQHAVRRIANGHITLFDNGNFHIPQFSRAVEYSLDENAKTATQVWQYRHVPDIFGFAMGYVQRLDNGNTIVSWGAADTAVTEVRPDGTVVFEMTLPHGVYSYRAYRFDGPSSLATALVAPADSSSGLSADPILRWNAVPGAAAYRLQVAKDSSFTRLVLDDSSITTASMRVSGLLLGAFYHWRVMPLYPAEAGRWSDSWSFWTAPRTVALIFPEDGARHVPLATELQWVVIPGSLTYRVQVAADPAFTLPIVNQLVTEPRARPGIFDSTTTYYWRVRWEHDTAVGEWSAAWSFSTVHPYIRQRLQSPLNGAADLPLATTLKWLPFDDAIRYRLQVATDSAFTSPLLDDPAITALSRRVDGLDTNTDYYWRVQPTTDSLTDLWSPAWSFRTGRLPDSLPAPAIPVYPPDQALVTSDSLRFVWESSRPYVSDYRFELAGDSAFLSPLIDSVLADTTVMVSTSLLGNATYWWRVSAINALGEGGFSQERKLTADIPIAFVDDGAMAARGMWLRTDAADLRGASLTVRYSVPADGHARLVVADERGATVATLLDAAVARGEGSVRFDGRGIPSGRYFIRLSTVDGAIVRKIVVER